MWGTQNLRWNARRVGKSWMYEGGDEKNRETFPHIPDEPSKPWNFYSQTFVVNGMNAWATSEQFSFLNKGLDNRGSTVLHTNYAY